MRVWGGGTQQKWSSGQRAEEQYALSWIIRDFPLHLEVDPQVPQCSHTLQHTPFTHKHTGDVQTLVRETSLSLKWVWGASSRLGLFPGRAAENNPHLLLRGLDPHFITTAILMPKLYLTSHTSIPHNSSCQLLPPCSVSTCTSLTNTPDIHLAAVYFI